MRKLFSPFCIIIVIALDLIFCAHNYKAEAMTAINITPVNQKATLLISPSTGTFLEGSNFEVPVYIDTQDKSINTIELYINFDPRKLAIIRPSGGQSIIGLWVEPPTYSNTTGQVKLVGAVPGGITTQRGLITILTFKVLATGNTSVTISNKSKVLANDGYGSEIETNFGRGSYTLTFTPPEGVRVFSETHPFPDVWYNNNNPIINWEKDSNISDFSFVIDTMPFTIPDNITDTSDSQISYQEQKEGISYFHIKARKKTAWGNTTHFGLKIDTSPPAQFTPQVEFIYNQSDPQSSRALISFFTTDQLAGIDRYEVGVIEKSASADISPVFVQAESPFLLPLEKADGSRIIIRAFDRAGNITDASIDIHIPFVGASFIKEHLTTILIIMLSIIVLLLLFHYLFGHHILSHFKKALEIVHQQEHGEIAGDNKLL